MSESEIQHALVRIVHEIIEKNDGVKNLVLVGIKRRGDFIARRIAERIKKSEGEDIPLGALDITLYRDDLQLVSETPIIEGTDISFDISNKIIVLVDDVLYTGRTIRAAIEELIDFGRPKAIQLAVLVDRGLRELPIQADYVGKKIPTSRKEIVDVHIKEFDGEDCVLIQSAEETRVKKPKKKTRPAPKGPAVEQLTITDLKEKYET